MVAPPGVPARFGFNVLGVAAIVLDAQLRSGSDYGINIVSRNTTEGVGLLGYTITLWGAPHDSSHDPERACPGKLDPTEGGETFCKVEGEPDDAFLRLPTSCSGPEPWSASVDSWYQPGALQADGEPDLADPAWQSASFLSHDAAEPPNPVGNTGCEAVPFEPSISVQPTTDRADSPTGLNVDLTMPQSCWQPGQVESTCQADVKDTSVTQPAGTRVNPATADGLSGCSEAQIGFIGAGFPLPNPTHFTGAEPTCPDSSKIGTVEIESPLVPDTLQGGIFQARQGENPFGSTLAFYAVASADGVMIKLPAQIKTDPSTGQVTTIFRDSPQLPFEHYKLHFFGGSARPADHPAHLRHQDHPLDLHRLGQPRPTGRNQRFLQDHRRGERHPLPQQRSRTSLPPLLRSGHHQPARRRLQPLRLEGRPRRRHAGALRPRNHPASRA